VKTLAFVLTRGRVNTTLPLCLMSVAMQDVRPGGLLIVDDTVPKVDLRSSPTLSHVFNLLTEKGIPWEVVWGDGRGMPWGHKYSQDYAKEHGYDFVWRLDDDEYAEPKCLKMLISEAEGDVGAVGGLVLTPPPAQRPETAWNRISDLTLPNIQWFKWDGLPEEVEHIHSSFLYRVGVAEFEQSLSPVAHREDTIFTHRIKRAGYKLIVTPWAVTWHFRNPEGGIRTYQDSALWEHDELVFRKELQKYELSVRPVYVLDCGLGDHYAFKSVMSSMKDGGAVVYCCYPDVFHNVGGVELRSIAQAKDELGDIGRFNIYGWMDRNKWAGHIADAFVEMYRGLN